MHQDTTNSSYCFSGAGELEIDLTATDATSGPTNVSGSCGWGLIELENCLLLAVGLLLEGQKLGFSNQRGTSIEDIDLTVQSGDSAD